MSDNDIFHLNWIWCVNRSRFGIPRWSVVKVFLHILDSLLVKRTLDLSGRLKVVETFEELEQFLCTNLDIFYGDLAILVEVETHPVVSNEHVYVLIVFSKVFSEFLLMLQDYFHQEREHLGGSVVNNVEIALDRGINSIVEELVQLHAVITHFVV